MNDLLPKVNAVYAYHIKNFEVLDTLLSSVNLRVQAEKQYQKSMQKCFQIVNEVQTDHPLYSKIIKSFKGLISQRIHQIKFFKEQIAKQSQTLKNAISPIEIEMKSQLAQMKSMEKQLRGGFEKMIKVKTEIDQKMKQLDEKFILNEISIIYKQNKNMRKNSQSILSEQQQLSKNLDSTILDVKNIVKKMQITNQQKQKKIWQLDVKVEQQFVDFIKKFNVHEISLIRNIQYDIDNMIKKTDIFNWQNTSQFKQKFTLKGFENINLAYEDSYLYFKKQLLNEKQILKTKQQNKISEVEYKIIKNKLENKNQADTLFSEIKKNYQQFKLFLYQFIEQNRKNNTFKFQQIPFKYLVYIFKEILKIAYQEIDFQGVQKVLTFSASYYCPKYPPKNKKRTVLEEIKQERFLSDLSFWKFYLFYCIKQSVISCLNFKEQKQIHMRNGVYSALLSNSLTMIQCGLEKHNIKNLIGKIAKTYGGLTEGQVAELLKVIEAAYDNLDKNKKNEQIETKDKTNLKSEKL